MNSYSKVAEMLRAVAEEAQKEKEEVYIEINNTKAQLRVEIDSLKAHYRDKLNRIIAILQEDDF